MARNRSEPTGHTPEEWAALTEEQRTNFLRNTRRNRVLDLLNSLPRGVIDREDLDWILTHGNEVRLRAGLDRIESDRLSWHAIVRWAGHPNPKTATDPTRVNIPFHVRLIRMRLPFDQSHAAAIRYYRDLAQNPEEDDEQRSERALKFGLVQPTDGIGPIPF